MDKLKASILGATGVAGQQFVEWLLYTKNSSPHPWFEIVSLAASGRSAGKEYGESIEDRSFFKKLPTDDVLEMKVTDINHIDLHEADVIFSALPSEIAKEVEGKCAKHKPVFSTASAFRYEGDVPILIPDVNAEHLHIIEYQMRKRGWKGYVLPGPNCTAAGLVITLKPLMDSFGINRVYMASMQALSGAGEKGIRRDSPYRESVRDNVLPFIQDEEEKVEAETLKVLGRYVEGKIVNSDIMVSCSCHRVWVEHGHTEAVFVEMKEQCDISEVKEAMRNFTGEPQKLKLPSAPERVITVLEEEDRPQPKLDVELYDGMTTLVGRVREDKAFANGIKYILLSDNTRRGAAAGSILTAEYCKVMGKL